MNEVIGKETHYVAMPEDAALNAIKDLQLPAFIIDLMISLNHTIAGGYAEEITDTVKKYNGA